LPGLCENFRPTTSKSSPILRLLSSHWATSVVRTRVVGVTNVGDSLRRLSSLQHRIYNLLGCTVTRRNTQRKCADSPIQLAQCRFPAGWPFLVLQEARLSPRDGPRDASRQLKSCQLPRNSAETILVRQVLNKSKL